jgi:hypothetical protein
VFENGPRRQILLNIKYLNSIFYIFCKFIFLGVLNLFQGIVCQNNFGACQTVGNLLSSSLGYVTNLVNRDPKKSIVLLPTQTVIVAHAVDPIVKNYSWQYFSSYLNIEISV